MVNQYVKECFDYHYLRIHNGVAAYLLAIVGFLSIGIFSSVISLSDNKVKKLLCYLGKNSLFIMATHEYLFLKEFVNLLIKIRVSVFLDKILEGATLIVIEILLCRVIGKYYNQLFSIGQRKN